ncbi:MAG: carbohydrate binding family 9 domain-containing protein, partial [Chloroflexi bacterium]|nr:carbohydrate binding family 9 domain-containing protein [Chloroflexota bacterium]
MTLAPPPASSQTSGSIADQPIPVLPATVSRGAGGDVVVRAVRVDQPPVLDGILDDEIYRTLLPASDFVQQYPLNGEPATEDTQVWISFDSDNVYVALRAWDSRPEQMVANEMRRDNQNIWQNDNVIVLLDTFLDRRSAFFFQTNPLGGIRDALVLNESTTNYDWNTVWDVKSRRDDAGWTVEMAIPFKSLRYNSESVQLWGFNVMRVVRSKNEQSLLSPVPDNAGGGMRMASAATLVGIEAPESSRNIEL